MTRQQIEAEFNVVNGIIRDPGKFEAAPVWAPYFWDVYLNGCADDDDGEVLTFVVTDEDRKEFPELANAKHVFLWETDCGFIGCDVR